MLEKNAENFKDGKDKKKKIEVFGRKNAQKLMWNTPILRKKPWNRHPIRNGGGKNKWETLKMKAWNSVLDGASDGMYRNKLVE